MRQMGHLVRVGAPIAAPGRGAPVPELAPVDQLVLHMRRQERLQVGGERLEARHMHASNRTSWIGALGSDRPEELGVHLWNLGARAQLRVEFRGEAFLLAALAVQQGGRQLHLLGLGLLSHHLERLGHGCR